ncbi:MAG: hypothetical protein ACK4K0_03440 [Flavobacteriales bacterium]
MTRKLFSILFCAVLFYSTGQKNTEKEAGLFGYSNLSNDNRDCKTALETYSGQYLS